MAVIIMGMLLIGTIMTIIGVLGGFGGMMVIGAGIFFFGAVGGAIVIPWKVFWKFLWVVTMIFLFTGLVTIIFTGLGFVFFLATGGLGIVTFIIHLFSCPRGSGDDYWPPVL